MDGNITKANSIPIKSKASALSTSQMEISLADVLRPTQSKVLVHFT